MQYYLTLDIGGTDIKYGVINLKDELVFKSSCPTNAHLGGANIINTIKNLFNELSKKYKLEGIAISTTGAVDETTKMLIPNYTIVDYDKVNFRDDLADLNVLVSAENDVNSMGLCEFSLVENYQNMNSLIALTIGTGIGGAIMINGKIFRGSAFTAGEVGKIIIDNNSSFEDLASTASLVRNAKAIYPNIENGLDVFNLYDNNDAKIIPVVKNFYNNLAIGIANLVHILNPDHIVIGGGISSRPQFLDELHLALEGKMWEYLTDKFIISVAKTKNDAGMIGAFKNFRITFNI